MRPPFVAVIAAASLIGCAMTPEHFEAQRTTLSDPKVCRVWLDALRNGPMGLLVDAESEARSRNLTRDGCASTVTSENTNAAIAGVAIVGAAALIATRRSGGIGPNGGTASHQAPNPMDYEWEWDRFRDDRRQIVWACRGVQTGQFADATHCTRKRQSDLTWPGD